jgi:ADP-ribosylglycohydrolase
LYALTRGYHNAEYWKNRVSVPSWMPVDGQSQGYVAVTAGLAYETLEYSTQNHAFDSLSQLIRLGGDTDTNASVAGALLGAYYGDQCWKHPKWLLDDLVDYDLWVQRADALYKLAMSR